MIKLILLCVLIVSFAQEEVQEQANIETPDIIENTETEVLDSVTMEMPEDPNKGKMRRRFLSSQCLDGSPSAYYHIEGNSDLVLQLYSGGFCIEDASFFEQFGDFAHVDNCSTRNTTFYGSTNNYPEYHDYPSAMLDPNDYRNKYLQNATKVYVFYCDGNIYHDQLKDRDFEELLDQIDMVPERVFLAGIEVGGIYLANKANRFNEILKQRYPDAQVRLILDSSIFIFRDDSNELRNAYNEVAIRNNKTLSQLISLKMISEIEIPTYIMQSQYDWYHLEIIHKFNCTKRVTLEACTRKQKKQIEFIRQLDKKELIALVRQKGWGLWSIGCLFHGFLQWGESWHSNMHTLDGLKLDEAFFKWVNGEEDEFNHIHQDLLPWPSNRKCSYLPPDEGDPQFEQIKRSLEFNRRKAIKEQKEREELLEWGKEWEDDDL